MAQRRDWTDDLYDPEEGEITVGQARSRLADARDIRTATSRKRVKQTKKARQDRKARDVRQAKLAAQREERLRTTSAGSQAERVARRREGERRTRAQERYRESQAAYRQQRDAQAQAYREEQEQARAERRAEAERARRRAAAGGPTFSSGTQGAVPSGGAWSPNKASVAKFIIFATAIGALGTVINSASGKAPTTQQQINGVTIPSHLRSLAGTFIAGAVALVVNEVYPSMGAVLGAGIVGLIVIPNWLPALARVGALSFSGLPVPISGGVSNLPGSKYAGPGGLQNPLVPWTQGSTAPAPFQGQSGTWVHQHFTAGNVDKVIPGDYWVWVPNG